MIKYLNFRRCKYITTDTPLSSILAIFFYRFYQFNTFNTFNTVLKDVKC